jgi:hypothetical protein
MLRSRTQQRADIDDEAAAAEDATVEAASVRHAA